MPRFLGGRERADGAFATVIRATLRQCAPPPPSAAAHSCGLAPDLCSDITPLSPNCAGVGLPRAVSAARKRGSALLRRSVE
jgi:hypothetical protein